jgi:hypothetical protein
VTDVHLRRSLVATLMLGACTATSTAPSMTLTAASTTTTTSTLLTPPTSVATTTTTTTTTAPTVDPHARPEWLGTRPLPLRPDGFGEVQPTPPELQHRAFATPAALAPPAEERFASTIGPIPAEVQARSTWSPQCPVTLDQLAYVTVSHWGFDGLVHTGELIVDAATAEVIVGVFQTLYSHRFPIEEMRVIHPDELDAPPTGDGNVTTAFVCRPAVGSTSWSMHAYGLAIDINPFHNPYLKGDLVLPELATFYLDRERALPGMILDGDPVVAAFGAIGWLWGGDWTTLRDWMHFSTSGR